MLWALPSQQGEEQTHQPEDSGRAGDRGENRCRRDEGSDTNAVTAQTVGGTDGPTLLGFVMDHAAPGAPIYMDDHTGHHGLRHHTVVRHSVKQYVDGRHIQTA